MTKYKLDALSLSQNAQFKQLDKNTASIVEELMQDPGVFASKLDDTAALIDERHNKSDLLTREHHKETMDALGRLQSPWIADPSFRLPTPGKAPQEREAEDVITTLLNSLKFRQMAAREEEIAEAHHGTFRWLVNEYPDRASRPAFSPLLQWLQTGNGCYWVSGKAG